MKTVIATDSFKGGMTSKEACDAAKRAIKRISKDIEVILCPMADGGEGTAEILNEVMGGSLHSISILDCVGNPMQAFYSISGDIAVMDVASCVGLETYLKNSSLSLDPWTANSYGVGQMMKDAVDNGCKELIIGLGGSCTSEGGMGILNAFGARFVNKNGEEERPCLSTIQNVEYIDTESFTLPDIKITVLCDVTNPLLGDHGAVYTFGKQKGIPVDKLSDAEEAMKKFADLVQTALHADIVHHPGSGAAGGIGGVLYGIFHAQMKKGIETVMKFADFDTKIKDADLIITGEGKTDEQTLHGKVPFGIIQYAEKSNVPVIIISGALGKGYEKLYLPYVKGIFSTMNSVVSLDEALKASIPNYEAAVYAAVMTFLGGKGY